jgi:hypothetical protein
MTSHIWQYEGMFDVTGNILTWETEGPVPSPQTPSRFREVTELKNPDHKVFTSSILGLDGSWNTIMTINIRRKKQYHAIAIQGGRKEYPLCNFSLLAFSFCCLCGCFRNGC